MDNKEKTRLTNVYRKEAITHQIRSPYRQSLYIKARFKGHSVTESIDRSTGNLRAKGYTK